jgi:hypothetical protein
VAEPSTASWRDGASAETQADVDGLLRAALTLAGQRLTADGGFYPVAATLSRAGDLVFVSGPESLGDSPTTEEVLEALYAEAPAYAASQRAFAFVADVTDADGRPGVRLEIEHKDGVALVLLVPYTRAAAGEPITYGEMEGAVRRMQIWTGSQR